VVNEWKKGDKKEQAGEAPFKGTGLGEINGLLKSLGTAISK